MGRAKSEGRRNIDANIRDIIRLYTVEWLTMKEIADRYEGASYPMVRDALLAAGVTLRSPHGHPARRTPPVAPTSETVREQVPLPLDAPADGDLVDLRAVRELAELTTGDLAVAIGLKESRTRHIERTPVGNLTVGVLARQVDGCAARLRVIVDFPGAETLAMYDSYRDGQFTA